VYSRHIVLVAEFLAGRQYFSFLVLTPFIHSDYKRRGYKEKKTLGDGKAAIQTATLSRNEAISTEIIKVMQTDRRKISTILILNARNILNTGASYWYDTSFTTYAFEMSSPRNAQIQMPSN